MEDAPILIAKKHRNPAVKEGKRTYLKAAEQHVDRSNVAGAALRALRLLQRDMTTDSDPKPSPSFFEVSPFTPWSKYGERFEAGVSQYKTVYIHLETDRKGRPTLMILGAKNNATLGVKLLHDEQRSHWASFERSFPKLAKIVSDSKINKITTSYQLTRQFLDLRRPSQPDKLVDVLLLANLLRCDDFTHIKKYKECTERLAGLCLIWSTLGEHKGPISLVDWEAAYGNGVPFPARRKADKLLKWPKAHRHEELTRSQIIYAEQLARAANTIDVHYFLWSATYSEMTKEMDEFGQAWENCIARGYGKSLTTGPGWMEKYLKVKDAYVKAVTISTILALPQRKVRFVPPSVDDYEPSIPRTVSVPRQASEPDLYDPEEELARKLQREQRQERPPNTGQFDDSDDEGSNASSRFDSGDVQEGPSHSSSPKPVVMYKKGHPTLRLPLAVVTYTKGRSTLPLKPHALGLSRSKLRRSWWLMSRLLEQMIEPHHQLQSQDPTVPLDMSTYVPLVTSEWKSTGSV